MTVDGPSVLVSGPPDRVGEIERTLADQFTVRTYHPAEDRCPTTDAEVVVYADGTGPERSPEPLPNDAAQVAVFEESDDFERERPATYDRVFVEPLVPDDLESTVESLARRVQYDRRLKECADLATQFGQAEATCDDGTVETTCELRKRVEAATAELDRLVSEFSSDDFRQAFRTIAAD